MASLKLEGLKKFYGATRAVDGIDLVVDDGVFLVLLGPSGCGKTTTLRCVAGLEKPSEGRVFFDERDVTPLRPSERNVGMVFQFYALYPHMRAIDNVVFPLKAQKVPRAEIDKKLEKMIKVFQLEPILYRRARELTPGDQQRVALARAVIRDPDVLLLDEPLSALDEKFREVMRGELGRLQKEIGVTTVYVTHDQREAMALGDVIAVMKEGKIIQIGSPEDLYEHPNCVFVGHFIGTPGMNFIDCTYAERKLFLGVDNLFIPLKEEKLLSELERLGNKKLILGIRPEYIEVSDAELENAVKVRLEAVEPAGRYRLVDFVIGDKVFRARVGWNKSLRLQENIYVRFKEEKLCIFDGDTGKALIS